MFLFYNPKHGITSMNKHVIHEHGLKLLKDVVHMSALKNSTSIWQKTKHKAFITPFTITKFFFNLKLYKKISPCSNVVHSRFCVDDCKRLYVVCCGEPLVEANSVPSLWSNTISISKITCSWVSSFFVIENHGGGCASYHWLICNCDNNFWLVDALQ